MSQQTPPPINIPDQPMAVITMAEYLALKETERRYEKEIPPKFGSDNNNNFARVALGFVIGVGFCVFLQVLFQIL